MSDLELLDWKGAKVGNPLPCIICDQPAFLRHPISQRPCRKVCHDDRARRAIAKAAR